MQIFKKIQPQVSDVIKTGSTALDLAYVANGNLDGFWVMGIEIWDIAAGILIVQEAGGMVSTFKDDQDYWNTNNIVCGCNYKIHKKLLENI